MAAQMEGQKEGTSNQIWRISSKERERYLRWNKQEAENWYLTGQVETVAKQKYVESPSASS